MNLDEMKNLCKSLKYHLINSLMYHAIINVINTLLKRFIKKTCVASMIGIVTRFAEEQRVPPYIIFFFHTQTEEKNKIGREHCS